MLLVSGINFNQKTTPKSIATTPNYIAKYHSQPTNDVINFSGLSAKSNKLPAELTDFISRYRLILGDLTEIQKSGDADYFECTLSSGPNAKNSMEIVRSYADLRNTALSQILKEAKPTLEGVQTFLKQLLDHRRSFPFILIPQRGEKIVIARQSYPETYIGAPYLGYHNSRIIRDTNPQLHNYVLEHESELYRDLLEHRGNRYSLWLQKDEDDGQTILTGIRLAKYEPASKDCN